VGSGSALGELSYRPRVLVVGGFGYLGGRIAQHLSAAGLSVVLGTRKNYKPPDWLPSCLTAQLDWSSTDALVAACELIDIVIHAAGMNAEQCSQNPVNALEFNGVATARLVSASQRAGVKKFIYISTAHVYRAPLTGTVRVNSRTKNLHPYATSHLAGEQALLSATRQGGMRGLVIRLSNVVGKPVSMGVDCWTLLVNSLCREAIEKKTLTIRGNPSDSRDFISLASVCEIFLYLVNHSDEGENRIHNVGSGLVLTLEQIAKIVSERLKIHTGREIELRMPNRRQIPALPLVYESTYFDCYNPLTEQAAVTDEIDQLLRFCELNLCCPR
jgi:UDP-glucose 4-epimerase